jgi:hypothetical protein
VFCWQPYGDALGVVEIRYMEGEKELTSCNSAMKKTEDNNKGSRSDLKSK